MNYFTIKDIENLCGIKAHTLRIWEQRYQLFTPKRKESRHRIYDNDDLKEMLRISFLYHNGHKISKIAEMDPQEIHDLVESSIIGQHNQGAYVHQLLEAGVDFDKEKFEQLVNELIDRFGLEKCITEVFFPFLERIGMLWMTNNVIPAQEHFVSHIIRNKIILAADALTVDKTGNPVIAIFAPCGEYHEIPLLVANYFFKKYNNRTVYFGVNVKGTCLVNYLENHSVSAVYSHIITKLDNEPLENYLCSLQSSFPGKQFVLSGSACKCASAMPGNVRFLHSINELIAYAQEINKTPSSLALHNS